MCHWKWWDTACCRQPCCGWLSMLTLVGHVGKCLRWHVCVCCLNVSDQWVTTTSLNRLAYCCNPCCSQTGCEMGVAEPVDCCSHHRLQLSSIFNRGCLSDIQLPTRTSHTIPIVRSIFQHVADTTSDGSVQGIAAGLHASLTDFHYVVQLPRL